MQGNLDPVALLRLAAGARASALEVLDQAAGGRATSSTWGTASCLRRRSKTSGAMSSTWVHELTRKESGAAMIGMLMMAYGGPN